MWPRNSHTLATFNRLTIIKQKLKWTQVKQDAFDKINRIVARYTLLTYTYFNEILKFNSYARVFQLGDFISQKGRPITFYIRKLTDAQQRYRVTDRELLSIVENIKEFKTILLGQTLRIYTDHKSLTCKKLNTNIVLISIQIL